MKYIIAILVILSIFVFGCEKEITSFEECVEKGYPIMESYPRQCSADGKVFVEQVEVHVVGDDKDEHGCIASAGYTWCEPKQKCLRTWEESCEEELVGDDKDEHGCIASAGYTWCEPKQKCLRTWEEEC